MSKTKLDIMIAQPGSKICAHCVTNILRYAVDATRKGVKVDYANVSGCSNIFEARQALLNHILEHIDPSLILWIDSDIIATPQQINDIIKIQRESRADIVSGVYHTLSGKICAGYFDQPKGCIKKVSGNKMVDWSGMGFQLWGKSVIDRVREEPRLFLQRIPDPKEGEDISFSRWAHNESFINLLAPIKVGHLKEVVL